MTFNSSSVPSHRRPLRSSSISVVAFPDNLPFDKLEEGFKTAKAASARFGRASRDLAKRPNQPAGIAKVKGASQRGVRMGNWLDRRQAERLINAPDTTILAGRRDRALFSVLIGCGLRRSEAAALTFIHIQQREGRWVIVDLVGKHGRIRS
jgi:integrase